jgi:hypothetical protein
VVKQPYLTIPLVCVLGFQMPCCNLVRRGGSGAVGDSNAEGPSGGALGAGDSSPAVEDLAVGAASAAPDMGCDEDVVAGTEVRRALM